MAFSVGVGGHATHGGFGPSSRRWGLAMDHIVGLDTVLANGTALHASKIEYPDVYYVSATPYLRKLLDSPTQGSSRCCRQHGDSHKVLLQHSTCTSTSPQIRHQHSRCSKLQRDCCKSHDAYPGCPAESCLCRQKSWLSHRARKRSIRDERRVLWPNRHVGQQGWSPT